MDFRTLTDLFSDGHIDTLAFCELAVPYVAGDKKLWEDEK